MTAGMAEAIGDARNELTVHIQEFLLARIAEDEALANAAIATDAPDPWENPAATGNHWPENIAFWDHATPYRLLRECAAKRAIVGPVAEDVVTQWEIWSRTRKRTIPADQLEQWGPGTGPSLDALYALAAVYADHPEYQEEWKP